MLSQLSTSSASNFDLFIFNFSFKFRAVIRDRPPLPPSKAQAVAQRAESRNKELQESSFSNYKRSIFILLKNVPFVLLLLTYGESFCVDKHVVVLTDVPH